jgi:hypothetical protein
LHPEQETISACKPNAADKLTSTRNSEIKEFIVFEMEIFVEEERKKATAFWTIDRYACQQFSK